MASVGRYFRWNRDSSCGEPHDILTADWFDVTEPIRAAHVARTFPDVPRPSGKDYPFPATMPGWYKDDADGRRTFGFADGGKIDGWSGHVTLDYPFRNNDLSGFRDSPREVSTPAPDGAVSCDLALCWVRPCLRRGWSRPVGIYTLPLALCRYSIREMEYKSIPTYIQNPNGGGEGFEAEEGVTIGPAEKARQCHIAENPSVPHPAY